jgi:hypothetical protein
MGISDDLFYGVALFAILLFAIWGLRRPRKHKSTGADIATANEAIKKEKEKAEAKAKEEANWPSVMMGRALDENRKLTESHRGMLAEPIIVDGWVGGMKRKLVDWCGAWLIVIMLGCAVLVFGYAMFVRAVQNAQPEYDTLQTGDTLLCVAKPDHAMQLFPTNPTWFDSGHQCLVIDGRFATYSQVTLDNGSVGFQVSDKAGNLLYITNAYMMRNVIAYTPSFPTPTQQTP